MGITTYVTRYIHKGIYIYNMHTFRKYITDLSICGYIFIYICIYYKNISVYIAILDIYILLDIYSPYSCIIIYYKGYIKTIYLYMYNTARAG